MIGFGQRRIKEGIRHYETHSSLERRGEEKEHLGANIERRVHKVEGLSIEVREGAFAWRRFFHGGGGIYMSIGAF